MNQPPLDVRRLVAYGVAVVRECISMNTSEPNPKWLLVLIISSFHINDLFICPTMQRVARSDGPRDVIRETHLACPLDDISTAWHRRSNSPPFFSLLDAAGLIPSDHPEIRSVADSPGYHQVQDHWIYSISQ